MPIAQVQLPDGRIAELEVPEGATEQQVMEFVQSQDFGQAPAQAAPEAAQAPQAQQAPQATPQSNINVDYDPKLPGILDMFDTVGKATDVVRTAGIAGAVGGAGSAMAEVGQAISDWTAKGLDWVGMEGLSEAAGKFANSLEGRERAIEEGSQQLAVDWFESMHGKGEAPEAVMNQIAKTAREGVDFSTKMGLAFAGGAATLGAKGVVGGVTKGTLEGTLSAALLSESDAIDWKDRFDKRADDTTLGAILGAGIGVGAGAFASARNFIANQTNTRVAGSRANEAFDRAEKFDITLSPGQASGSPFLQNIEEQAKSDIAQKFFRDQANTAGEKIGARVGLKVQDLDKVGRGTGKAIRETESKVKLAVAKLKMQRNQAWRSDIEKATEVAGDAPLYKPESVVAALRDVEKDVAETFGNKVPLSKDMMDMIDEIESAAAGGGINASQINKWWKRTNEWKSSGFGVFDSGVPGVKEGQYKNIQQVFAGKLSGAIDDSIQAAGANATGAQREALELLKGARTKYKAVSDDVRLIEDDFLGALGMDGSPRQIMEKLSRVDPDISQLVVGHVKKLEGGEQYVKQLEDSVFDSSIFAGMEEAVATGAQKGDVAIDGFAKALASGTRRSVLAGISEPAVEKRAAEGVKILRDILNEGAQQSKSGVMQRMLPMAMQDVAINAISRNNGFMSRLVANAIARGENMESLFFTPEGIKILRSFRPEMVKHGASAGTRNAGIVLLTNSISENAKEEAGKSFQESLNEIAASR